MDVQGKTFYALLAPSQNHRMAEVGRGPLKVIWFCSPAQAGPSRAGCPGPCPDDFGISPKSETPQSPWVTCARSPNSEK